MCGDRQNPFSFPSWLVWLKPESLMEPPRAEDSRVTSRSSDGRGSRHPVTICDILDMQKIVYVTRKLQTLASGSHEIWHSVSQESDPVTRAAHMALMPKDTALMPNPVNRMRSGVQHQWRYICILSTCVCV